MGTSDRSPAITQAAKHYRRGLEDFRGGRFREAARHLRKAVDVAPGFRIYRETAAAGWAGALAQLGRDLAAALAAEHRSAAVHD